MDKKKIIIIAVSALVAVGIVVGVVAGISHKKKTDGVSGKAGDILVVKDGNLNVEGAGEEVEDIHDGELELMTDDGPVSLDNGSDVAGGNSTTQTGTGGNQKNSDGSVTVVNPVAPSGQVNVGTANSQGANNSTGSNNSSSGSESGSSSSGSDKIQDLIIEDGDSSDNSGDASDKSSYDASEGRSYETERIPVN